MIGAIFLVRGTATLKDKAPDEVSGAGQYLARVYRYEGRVTLALRHIQDILIVFRPALLDDISVIQSVDGRLRCWRPVECRITCRCRLPTQHSGYYAAEDRRGERCSGPPGPFRAIRLTTRKLAKIQAKNSISFSRFAAESGDPDVFRPVRQV